MRRWAETSFPSSEVLGPAAGDLRWYAGPSPRVASLVKAALADQFSAVRDPRWTKRLARQLNFQQVQDRVFVRMFG